MIPFIQCLNEKWSEGLHHLLLLFRFNFFLGFSVFLLLSPLHAQTVGKIAGIVTEASTGKPLVGANIELEGMMMGAASDTDGVYFILNIPPGKYELRASMIGYKATKVIDVIVNAGKTTNIDFELEEEILEGEEVVVTAERPDVERDKTSTSAIVRFDDVQSLPGIRDINDVLSLGADVNDGHFRGGREGEEYYILQGMGIVNPLDRSSAFLPIMSGVEEVEVITSGFGAQYGNAQSGIVNISMKEGDRNIWKTRIESRMRAPGRKHFGPSVYDPNANVYLGLLQNEDVWLEGDPGSETQNPYYTTMISGFSSSFMGDTTVQLAVAQALWGQMKRDIGKKYGNEIDYSLETATGGPINDKMRMFLALRSNQENSIFPTENPNVEYQAMGNVVTDLGKDMMLRISGGFAQEYENDFNENDFGGSGFQNWLWDRITGVQERKRVNLQLGARFTKTLSQSTYYELKVNSLFTNNQVGSTPFPQMLDDSLRINWDAQAITYPSNRSPDGFSYQAGRDDFDDEKTRTISVDGSYTSQVTKSHLVNTGLQINSYYIDVSNTIDVTEETSREIERYTAHPFEAAIYAQDKMEFEGLIANVGLRFDLWYSGVDYYTDLYVPFGEPDSGMFNPSNAEQKKSPVYTGLQPRLGFSFPISENTVFHLNYGAFMQRPSFQYIVLKRLEQIRKTPATLGNPRLKPERTNSYDIGVTQALGEGFTIDVSGYYKDVKNLVQEVELQDQNLGYQVNSYFNIDYADIRGFRISLNKRRGSFTGSINYQYGYATGKSASPTSALPHFDRDTSGVVTTDLNKNNVPDRDITLDFDQTHNVVITASYLTKQKWGPSILNTKPFADINVSVYSSIQSGRPYTSPSHRSQINVERSPMEYNTDLRVTKRIRNFAGISVSFYVETFNLFNDKILNYDYLFERPSDTNPNLPLQYYEQYPINDKKEGIRYWSNKPAQGPFSMDLSSLIYDNQPRSYSFGVVFEF